MAESTPTAAPAAPAAGLRAAELLQRELPDAVVEVITALGEVTVVVHPERIVEVMTMLRDHPDTRYSLPLHVTAVDWPEREPALPRFDVVYQLRSMVFNDVCRVMARVPEEDPRIATVETVFAGMDWHERETYDLLGIVFDGHHDLRRILLPDDWEGHPLRKDYVSFGEPIAFTHNIEWALPSQERPPGMPGSSR
jgi:NADH-quinone oxidoreductase subunit C